MKSKKTLWLVLALVAAVLAVGLLIGLWQYYQPKDTPSIPNDPDTSDTTDDSQTAGNTFTVIVVHGNGSEKTFQYTTEEQYLGPVLVSEGLVEGETGAYGLYIKVVDGEKAVYEEDAAYWSIYIGEEGALTGADQIAIEDGATYKLVYTKA